MKILFLMRHGLAPSPAEAGVATDAQRPISEQGRSEVGRMARIIVERGGHPRLVLHSPLTRAAQTALAALPELAPAAATESFNPLDNTCPPEALLAALEKRGSGLEEILAIGHQPQIGELACLLTGTRYDISPGGVVAVQVGRPSRVLWALNPHDPT